MNVLFAFDKFKDNMSAAQACEAAASGWSQARPGDTTTLAPLTDGGEGFAEMLTQTAGGQLQRATVTGPLGQPVPARWGLVDGANLPTSVHHLLPEAARGSLAIIEMAQAAGLEQVPMPERDAWETDTRGVGELIRAAAHAGAQAILLGIGGSATNDLGLGALTALGLQLLNRRDATVSPAPANWHEVTQLKGQLGDFPPIIIACDVTNPLLGKRGATAVYGPQKGLKPTDFEPLETAMTAMAAKLQAHFHASPDTIDEPGAGAAGGLGAGLRLAGKARFVPGFDLVQAWIEVEHKLAEAAFIVTGEGKFDQSSLEGKGPGLVLRRALSLGKPCHVLAGHLDKDLSGHLPPGLNSACLGSIDPPGMPLAEALQQGPQNMALAARNLAESL